MASPAGNILKSYDIHPDLASLELATPGAGIPNSQDTVQKVSCAYCHPVAYLQAEPFCAVNGLVKSLGVVPCRSARVSKGRGSVPHTSARVASSHFPLKLGSAGRRPAVFGISPKTSRNHFRPVLRRGTGTRMVPRSPHVPRTHDARSGLPLLSLKIRSDNLVLCLD